MRIKKFLQHPSFHYCLLTALGAYGIFAALPIDFHPQSSIERIDLGINLLILIPASLLTVLSSLLAIFCAVFDRRIDEESRFAKFPGKVLKKLGFSNLLLTELAMLGPLGLLTKTFHHLFGDGEHG